MLRLIPLFSCHEFISLSLVSSSFMQLHSIYNTPLLPHQLYQTNSIADLMIMQGLKETDGLTRTEEGEEGEEEDEEKEGKGEGKGKRDPNTFPITLPYTPLVPPTTPPSRVLTEKFTRPIPITRSPVPHSHSHPRPRSATFTRKMPSKLSAVLYCIVMSCGVVWCGVVCDVM